MSSEEHVGRREQVPTSPIVPGEIAERFLSDSLQEVGPLIYEDEESRIWRAAEQEVDVPNLGKALLQVGYRQFRSNDDAFDQMQFDYVAADANEEGTHQPIAEMHWYIERGEQHNPYPFDLMMVHRYVEPEYRNHRGVGKSLYQQAEAWAQQVANKKKEALTLALSTDQPLTMDWAEGLGYTAYPEEAARRREVLEHPEQFELISETDMKGQIRNPALSRDGRRHRVWFKKVLRPQSS